MHPLAERIKREFAGGFVDAVEWRGDLAVTVKREAVHAIAEFLRRDPEIDCDYMVHVSSVDWPDDE
jgi:NADH-quinone oxidoreductase subunit C